MRYKFLFFFLIIFSLKVTAQNYFHEKGKASFYADKFDGRKTASGEKFRQNRMTAAHKTLPFGTLVLVKNISNGKTVEVVINDRGPFIKGRIIDLSKSAATKLGFVDQGVTQVEIEVVKPHDPKHKIYQRDKPNMQEPLGNHDTYFDISVSETTPKGFGVQIGSFEEQANLLAKVNDLRKNYKKKVTIQLTNLNGKKLYKVIVGQVSSRKEAETLKTKVQKEFPGCFIVNFGD